MHEPSHLQTCTWQAVPWFGINTCLAVAGFGWVGGVLELYRVRGPEPLVLAGWSAVVLGAAAILWWVWRRAHRAGHRSTARLLPVLLVLTSAFFGGMVAPALHRARSGATNNADLAEAAALWRVQMAAEGKPIPLLFEMMLDGMVPDRSFTCFYGLADPDDYRIGQYSYADLLRGRVTRAELRAEAEKVGLLDQAWERAGPYVVCRDVAALRSQEPVVVAYTMGSRDQYVYCPVVASNGQWACRFDEEESRTKLSEWAENARRAGLPLPPDDLVRLVLGD